MPKAKTKPTNSKSTKASESPAKKGHRSSRLLKRKRYPKPTRKLSGSFRIFVDSISLLRQHWKLFGGIILVYIILNLLLVGGLSGGYNITELKETFTQDLGQIGASVALFGILLGSTGSTNTESGAVYQMIVVLLVSLATIWALRHVLAGEKVRIRDAFYKGMYPLVPFVLILFYICMQLIPALIGSLIYSLVFGGGIATGLAEKLLFSAAVLILVGYSLYLLGSSLFALYIVSLPDMRPVAAIKAARKLVRGRRWLLIRKLIFLPFALLVIGAIVFLPLIMFAPGFTVIAFAVLSVLALVFGHTYVYSLYRELI